LKRGRGFGWHAMSWEQRRAARLRRPPYWIVPARNTADRAAAMLPGLMRERMDEFGIDFSVMYPTQGIVFMSINDEEMRRAAARAMNIMNAELFQPHAARLTPAATIPMHSPAEAIAELDYAVGTLGLKAIMIESNVRRRIASPPVDLPALARAGGTFWIDPLALDSEYDYDPVWQKCVDLKVAPTTHSGTQGWPNRASISSYIYNHIGHFAAAGEVLAKALMLGGVMHRFPTLRLAFLEGGAGWGVALYHDLIGHFEKRSHEALKQHLNPRTIDRQALVTLVERYGDEHQRAKADELRLGDGLYRDGMVEDDDEVDEWRASGIRTPRDVYDLFVPRFYFGCEAEDRSVAWAFNGRLNRFGARIQAMFSSDIGHWDVTDARHVVAESYELVEDGHLSPEDYHDFVFGHAVTLRAGMNPDFFKGTVVEDAVTRLLAGPRVAPMAAA
jgi:predicted TIM-barrel fold metal-dependent hydrolase